MLLDCAENRKQDCDSEQGNDETENRLGQASDVAVSDADSDKGGNDDQEDHADGNVLEARNEGRDSGSPPNPVGLR